MTLTPSGPPPDGPATPVTAVLTPAARRPAVLAAVV